jgi:hypothetical protein
MGTINSDDLVFIDHEHDTVAVMRWIDDKQKDELMGLLEASLTST